MRLRWTLPAVADLEQIHNYLSSQYPHIANPTVRQIYSSVRGLKRFPNRGRIGLRSGTRELVLHPLPYIVVYQVTDQAIHVLHIDHGAQNRSPVLS